MLIGFKKDPIMIEDIAKLLEKQNLLALFRYNTQEEIEKASGTGKKTLMTLLDKYSDEIKAINNATFLCNAILKHQLKFKI